MSSPRARTPSGHDIPIPESVFQALHDIQQENRTWQENHDSEHRDLRQDIKVALAGRRHDWAKIIGAIAAAIPLIVGGVRVSTPTPEPARVEVIPSPVDPRMAECRSLQPGTQAQGECFARVQADIQAGRR